MRADSAVACTSQWSRHRGTVGPEETGESGELTEELHVSSVTGCTPYDLRFSRVGYYVYVFGSGSLAQGTWWSGDIPSSNVSVRP
jgi:hypothetical protein